MERTTMIILTMRMVAITTFAHQLIAAAIPSVSILVVIILTSVTTSFMDDVINDHDGIVKPHSSWVWH